MRRPSAPRRLADQPVRTREERHEDQGADQDRHDVDRDLRVAETPHIDEAVGVLVREGASHERVRHPRDRDQQGAPQCRPGDAAARSRERCRAHEGGRDDDVLQRVRDEREAGEHLVGTNQGRINDGGHRDHHEGAQVRGPPPRPDAASTREDVLELAPATVSSDVERAQVARIEVIADAVDQAAAGTFWLATQTLFDSEEDMDWRIVTLVDVPASNEANRVALATITVGAR